MNLNTFLLWLRIIPALLGALIRSVHELETAFSDIATQNNVEPLKLGAQKLYILETALEAVLQKFPDIANNLGMLHFLNLASGIAGKIVSVFNVVGWFKPQPSAGAKSGNVAGPTIASLMDQGAKGILVTPTGLKAFAVLLMLCSLPTLRAQDAPPQYVLATGGSYNRYGGPPIASGWISAGTLVGAGFYSFTTMDLTSKSSSMRTGFARQIFAKQGTAFWLHADGGVTNIGSDASLGTVGGGAMITQDLGQFKPSLKGWGIIGVLRVLGVSSDSVKPVFEFGFTRSF